MTLPLICITIPTYNRNDLLNTTVIELLEQLGEDCYIQILDNCSDIPVSVSLSEVLRNYPQHRVDVHRNEVNIGCNANIVKCFEICQSEWVWLLSDDDAIMPNAINTIREAILFSPESIYVSFPVKGNIRLANTVTTGRTEFIEKLSYYADMNLISNNVFRCETFKCQIQLGYRFTYSCAPFLAMLFNALNTQNKACLFTEPLISGNATNPGNIGWSWLPFALGRMTILDLPLTHVERRILAGKIIDSQSILGHISMLLILQAYYEGSRQESLYLYDQITSRYFYYGNWLTRNLVVRFFRLLIAFPTVGYRALRLIRSRSYLDSRCEKDALLRI